jgi:hypothetical protein
MGADVCGALTGARNLAGRARQPEAFSGAVCQVELR